MSPAVQRTVLCSLVKKMPPAWHLHFYIPFVNVLIPPGAALMGLNGDTTYVPCFGEDTNDTARTFSWDDQAALVVEHWLGHIHCSVHDVL